MDIADSSAHKGENCEQRHSMQEGCIGASGRLPTREEETEQRAKQTYADTGAPDGGPYRIVELPAMTGNIPGIRKREDIYWSRVAVSRKQ